jgi:hypothetical protein
LTEGLLVFIIGLGAEYVGNIQSTVKPDGRLLITYTEESQTKSSPSIEYLL